MYYVYGDYGTAAENELHQEATQAEAIRWANRYVRRGDFGGYDRIEVASFDADGKYVVHREFFAEDVMA